MNELKAFFETVQTIFPLRAIIAAAVFVVGMIWYALRGRKQ